MLRKAAENATWRYTRIQGALKNLGHRVGRSTIARILKAHGVPPSRQRPMAWRTFVRAHWPARRAADVFMNEVWRLRRFVTFGTAFITALHPRTSRRFSAAVSRRRPAQGHTSLDEQIADELEATHSDLRMRFEEVWWHEPAARHSGRPRAPDTCRRAERRYRCRAIPRSMKEMSLSRCAVWPGHLRPGPQEFKAPPERAHLPSARQRSVAPARTASGRQRLPLLGESFATNCGSAAEHGGACSEFYQVERTLGSTDMGELLVGFDPACAATSGFIRSRRALSPSRR